LRKYEKVIDVIKSDLLGINQITSQANLRQTQARVIVADLIDQGIVKEIFIHKRKKYEYVHGSQPLNTLNFNKIVQAKLEELDKMVEYAETSGSRMKFLCDCLNDETNYTFKNCDNTGLKKIERVIISDNWIRKLKYFHRNFYPLLETQTSDNKMIEGLAAAYYGVTYVGKTIQRSKYKDGGDFPDFLIDMTLRAIRRKFGNEHFDLIVYVPPTKSGNLVRNFADKIGQTLQIPVSHGLRKIRETSEQKIFESTISKKANVKDAFDCQPADEIAGKTIMLLDDIFDSGATIKEIGRLLTRLGAAKIVPVTIAKTVGGDKI